uniref:Fucolectin-1-like n=1 Tax=Saccoglossus kowalevskii TaxID=10224 RepID=A0ABM0MWP3_SACKO|nr:PREDICTED: fucolectin-1-like [Saccoglossus kowalevskii]
MDCCSSKLANAEVHIGDSETVDDNKLCGARLTKRDVLDQETVEVVCNCPNAVMGRYVSIQLKEVVQVLSLCEVEVYVLL